jgi:hypothetical protein
MHTLPGIADLMAGFLSFRPNGTTTFHPLTHTQRALSDETISYMIAFVASGDPNSPHPPVSRGVHLDDAPKHISPAWPPHTSGKRLVIRARSGGTGAMRGTNGGSYIEEFDASEVARCGVWEKIEEGYAGLTGGLKWKLLWIFKWVLWWCWFVL